MFVKTQHRGNQDQDVGIMPKEPGCWAVTAFFSLVDAIG